MNKIKDMDTTHEMNKSEIISRNIHDQTECFQEEVARMKSSWMTDKQRWISEPIGFAMV